MSPKPDVSEERIEQITEAATKVFSKQGFDKARMDDIASEAKLSKGTLYLYFKSKDAIIKHLLEKLFEREFSDLSAHANADLPASEKLMLFTDTLIADLKNWSRLIPIMYEFLGRLFRQSVVQQAFKEYMRSYLEITTPIFQEGIDAGEFYAENAEALAISFGALFEGTILLWVYDKERVDLQKHTRTGIDLLIKGLMKE